MAVGRWARRLIAGAACLAMMGLVCLPVVGCAKATRLKGESEMPAKAKAKAEQMREEGMKGGGSGAMKGKGVGKGMGR